MRVKSGLTSVGRYALGAAIVLAILALPVLLILGGVWIGEKVLPWLLLLCILALLFSIVILGPLALIRRTRPWAGGGFYVVSYIFGLTGWFMGLILTWTLWGGGAVVIGLVILGIGVIPIAMLATLLKAMWLDLGLLIAAVVLTYGLRVLGLTLAESSEEDGGWRE